jgi:hypothetical protein
MLTSLVGGYEYEEAGKAIQNLLQELNGEDAGAYSNNHTVL